MSRSGYSEDIDNWELIRWRGAVKASIRGKRGQALLSQMATALDAMPQKKLIAESLITPSGEVCALGAVAKLKSLKVDHVDPNDSELVASTFNVSEALVKEIAFENDVLLEYGVNEAPEVRWVRMRKWVAENLNTDNPKGTDKEAGK